MHAAQNPTTPLKIFEVLIKQGANVNLRNSMGRTAFFYLNEGNHQYAEIVKMFIESGIELTPKQKLRVLANNTLIKDFQ